MMHTFYHQVAFLVLMLLSQVHADDNATIVGTWSSKSSTVFTGPGFYDPVDELLIEPALPGMSFSFTDDGFFEQAIYQVSSDSKNHSCATAVLIFQHGEYEVMDNGSLYLTPYEVDGRQLLSDPCNDGGVSVYSRYNQTELYKTYEVFVSPYYGRWVLRLEEWDGTPMQPMYLAYRPPMMLPTETMNPTEEASSTGTSSSKLRKRIRRSLENKGRTRAVRKSHFNVDFWWWTSVGLVGVGSLGYFFL